MNKIEVAVLNEAHQSPSGMMMFLARLTQRGHNIDSMDDLQMLYLNSMHTGTSGTPIQRVVELPHGTIKRFAPITIAIVGASRRFLAQARTNQVGIDYVSASLQYSDYSGKAAFVVPYSIIEADSKVNLSMRRLPDNPNDRNFHPLQLDYLKACEASMEAYADIAKFTDNDTAGYVAPQGLRNVLIMQANHESWAYFLRLRTCKRNTNETRYVATLMWQELLKTADGVDMFSNTGPDCLYGQCREGSMSCGKPYPLIHSFPHLTLKQDWPLLYKGE